MSTSQRNGVKTKKNLDNVDVKRRELVVAGLAGASVFLMTNGSSVLAAEEKDIKRPKGVDIKVIKELESMIPGYPKVRLREVTFQPGANNKREMTNAMICECTLGALEVKQNDKSFIAEKGHVWACKIGDIEENTNKGGTPAVMRVFDLLSA